MNYVYVGLVCFIAGAVVSYLYARTLMSKALDEVHVLTDYLKGKL